jgi:predicted metal-binding membrane protein
MPATMAMSIWTPMPGQTWAATAASFLGNWTLMMAAMMLPSLVPALRQYARGTVEGNRAHTARMRVIIASAYLFVWTLVGAVVFPFGAALAAVQAQHPALARIAPFAIASVFVVAGLLQFSEWKSRHLASCRMVPVHADTAFAAWRFGLRLGRHCIQSSAGLMSILLMVGMMDVRAMVAVTAAMTIERLPPNGEYVARVVGAVAMVAGIFKFVT